MFLLSSTFLFKKKIESFEIIASSNIILLEIFRFLNLLRSNFLNFNKQACNFKLFIAQYQFHEISLKKPFHSFIYHNKTSLLVYK